MEAWYIGIEIVSGYLSYAVTVETVNLHSFVCSINL